MQLDVAAVPQRDDSAAGMGEMAVDRGAADAEGLGDRGDRVVPGPVYVLNDLELAGGHDRGSAAVAAPGPGRGQPGGGAFADEVAFEFG
jgi:hypothetical protein